MDLIERLRERRLLAIIRADTLEAGLACTHVLVEEGVDLIEVSLTSADALDLISKAHAELGDAVALGAGTVLTAEQAHLATRAGASYLVTPSLSPGADEGVRMGVPVLMGALTPTEVAGAVQRGAAAVKVFPADLFGPRYLTELRAPFPDIPLVPVGGVDADAARRFLAAGALAVGVSSPLLGDAARGGSLDSLRDRARELLAVVG